MRIRSTKPEFWRSKTIARLPWDVRLVLKGLESYVDDNGVGKDDIALIAADVFPRDLSANPPETLARLTEAIQQLSDGGLVTRYCFDGEDLIYIERWRELQRIDKPTKGRFPRPDGSMDYVDPVIREDYANPPEVVAPVTGEQGSRGTGENASRSGARRPLRPIPDDWQPNLTHRAKLNNLVPGIDLEHEAEQFRQHARSTGRECASWDAAFHTWLGKAKPRARPGVAAATTKAQGWLDIANSAADHNDQRALG